MNYKSFVFNSTDDSVPLVTPSGARYHLYITKDGQMHVINRLGEFIHQDTSAVATTGGTGAVSSVNGQIGDVVLSSSELTATTFVSVYHAGTATANRVFRANGTLNGKVRYTVPGATASDSSIQWESPKWLLRYDGTTYYESTDAVATPDLITTWAAVSGVAPLPKLEMYSGTTQQILEAIASTERIPTVMSLSSTTLTLNAQHFNNVIIECSSTGATLYGPGPPGDGEDYTSTWYNTAIVYPTVRNNIIVNRGANGNTSTQVLARLSADTIMHFPKVVFLGSCNNDYPAITDATRTSNIQSSLNMLYSANIKPVLVNALYRTEASASSPGYRNYYENWWQTSKGTLTGAFWKVNPMVGLKNSSNYVNPLYVQADEIHPNPSGYSRYGKYMSNIRQS